MRHVRSLVLLLVGVLIGAIIVTPAGAHLKSFKHLRSKHFFTKAAAKARFLSLAGGTLTGPLTVPSITYSAPRTHRLNIPPHAFGPAFDGYAFEITDTEAAATGGPLVAPVSLPDGATVKTLILWANDSAAGSPDHGLRLRLQRRALGPVTVIPTMAVAQTSGADGIHEESDSSIAAATVDNSQYTYSLRVSPWNNGDQIECCWEANAIRAVHILYTLPGPA